MTDVVREFTADGNTKFAEFLIALKQDPTTSPPWSLLEDPTTSQPCSFSANVERTPNGTPFASRYDFGQYLAQVLQNADRADISFNHALWNWLSLYFFDQLSPADADGKRSMREVAVYLLPARYVHNRYYRHLVRSPWLAVSLHPEQSRVILIPRQAGGNPLSATGELFEQVASRQGVLRSATVLDAAYELYWDPVEGRPRFGAGASTGGTPRRFGKVLKQFELTYDLEWPADGLVFGILPKEFARFKAKAASPPASVP